MAQMGFLPAAGPHSALVGGGQGGGWWSRGWAQRGEGGLSWATETVSEVSFREGGWGVEKYFAQWSWGRRGVPRKETSACVTGCSAPGSCSLGTEEAALPGSEPPILESVKGS